MRYRTRTFAIVGASLVVIGGIPVTLGLARFFVHPSSAFASSFDSQVWRSHRGYCAEKRGGMIADLVAHHLERGMGRDEIAQLLGREDSREGKGRLVWMYKDDALSLLPGCGYLTIRFDSGGRVTGWEQYMDD